MQRPDPRGEVDYGSGRVAPGDGPAESDDCVPVGRALAEPRPPSADRDLDLHGGFEPVDVGTVQEPHFDEAHGAASIGGTDRRTRRR